jgi:hypothetical protein
MIPSTLLFHSAAYTVPWSFAPLLLVLYEWWSFFCSPYRISSTVTSHQKVTHDMFLWKSSSGLKFHKGLMAHFLTDILPKELNPFLCLLEFGFNSLSWGKSFTLLDICFFFCGHLLCIYCLFGMYMLYVTKLYVSTKHPLEKPCG